VRDSATARSCRSRRTVRITLAGGVIALMIVSVAGAQAPDATLLVLQPTDVSGLTVSTPPQQSNETISPKTRGRVAGAVSSYYRGAPIWTLHSRAEAFRDATAAHQAFLEASAELARRTQLGGATVPLGQEGRSYNHIVLGYNFVWRQGNVVAFVNANLGRGPGTDGNDYGRLQNSRILARVPPADPGPPVVVKPVIGKPTPEPAQPRAGRRFTLTFRVTWSDDGSALTSASVVTKTSITSKAVPHRYSFGAGRLTVSLAVPRTAKGKQLKITATVRAENRATTKTVAYRVR
jgi:hypothetical protein